METAQIEKLVPGGQGIATLASGKKAFIWNALPGETVDFTITKQKSSYCEGVATRIIHASSARISPRDDCYLATSLKWLTDQVYVIRQNACKILKKIYGTCKSEEFKKKLLNKIGSMAKNESYLIRTTVVLLIKEFLKDEYELDFVEKKLFPILAKLSKDLISNVRQSCAQAVKKLVRLSKNKDVVKECKDIIDELKIDKDMEVVYAANDN